MREMMRKNFLKGRSRRFKNTGLSKLRLYSSTASGLFSRAEIINATIIENNEHLICLLRDLEKQSRKGIKAFTPAQYAFHRQVLFLKFKECEPYLIEMYQKKWKREADHLLDFSIPDFSSKFSKFSVLYNNHGRRVFNLSPESFSSLSLSSSKDYFLYLENPFAKEIKSKIEEIRLKMVCLPNIEKKDEKAGESFAQCLSLCLTLKMYNYVFIERFKNLYAEEDFKNTITPLLKQIDEQVDSYLSLLSKIHDKLDEKRLDDFYKGMANYLKRQEEMWKICYETSNRLSSNVSLGRKFLFGEKFYYGKAYYQEMLFHQYLPKNLDATRNYFSKNKEVYSSLGTILRLIALLVGIGIAWWQLAAARDEKKQNDEEELLKEIKTNLAEIDSKANKLLLEFKPLKARNFEMTETSYDEKSSAQDKLFDCYYELHKKLVLQRLKLENVSKKIEKLNALSEGEINKLKEKCNENENEIKLLTIANEAKNLFERKKVFAAKEEIDKILSKLNDLKKKDGDESKTKIMKIFIASVYNLYAEIHEKAYDFKGASKYYGEALNLNPEHPVILTNQVLLYGNILYPPYFDKNDDELRRQLSAEFETLPHPKASEEKKLYFEDKLPTQLLFNMFITSLIKMHRAQPDDPHILNTIAWIYFVRSHYYKDEQALKQKGFEKEALKNEALKNEALKRAALKKAEDFCNRALYIVENHHSLKSSRLNYHLGRICEKINELDKIENEGYLIKAKENIKKAILQRPIECAYMNLELAEIKIKLREDPIVIRSDIEKAKEYYERMIDLMNENNEMIKFYERRINWTLQHKIEKLNEMEKKINPDSDFSPVSFGKSK